MREKPPAVRDRAASLVKESFFLAALLLLFVAANLLALESQPVFSDEPCYTDPAASFIMGRGFTSGAWYAQPDGEFFASNVPLHELAMIPWLKTFGFGILQTRSINWLYSIAAILLVWDAARRAGWINKLSLRLTACALMLFTESAYSINQLGRPDGITFLIAAVAAWSLALQSPKWRMCLLFITGAAAVWAGLQLAVALFLTCIVGFVVWRMRWFLEMTSLGSGILIGILALFAFYQHHGVWHRFVESVLPNTSSRDIYSFTGFFSDRSFLLIAACAAIIFVRAIFGGDPPTRRTAVFGCAMLAGLPLGLLACGKFSTHYTWMPVMAGTLCAMSVLERLPAGKTIRWIMAAILILAITVGYPRRAGISLVFADDDIHIKTERFVAAQITPDDHVIYAAQAYFPVKRIAEKAYYYNWYPAIMPADEAAAVNVMVIEPRTLEEMKTRLGGEWHAVGKPLGYPIRRFPNKDLGMDLAVYRRVPTSAGHAD